MAQTTKVYKVRGEMPDYIYDECYKLNFGNGGEIRHRLTEWADQTKNCKRAKPRAGYVVTIEIEGHVVGWSHLDKNLDWSAQFYVEGCCRRLGFGAELVETTKRVARRKNIDICRHDPRSEKFFDAIGM